VTLEHKSDIAVRGGDSRTQVRHCSKGEATLEHKSDTAVRGR
jgi:hypothetical protein